MRASMHTLGDAMAAAAAASQSFFKLDRSLVGVALERRRGSFEIVATRNTRRAVPFAEALPPTVQGVPVRVDTCDDDATPLASHAECGVWRPLRYGLQVANVGYARRTGRPPATGSVGCFLEDNRGSRYLLSANHVLAVENQGKRGDAVAQNASGAAVGVLHDYVPLWTSPASLRPPHARVRINRVDAAVALLAADAEWENGFLPHHPPLLPTVVRRPEIGERVFKVGAGTTRTEGTVDQVVLAQEFRFGIGSCWFGGLYAVADPHFAERGDSGAVVCGADGALVGLLIGGNGRHVYFAPLQPALDALKLRVAGLASVPAAGEV